MPNKIHKCIICNQNVCKTQESVQCIGCELWFHTHCANINDEAFTLIKEVKSLSFTCGWCKECPRKPLEKLIRDEISGIDKKIDALICQNEGDLKEIKNAFSVAVDELKSDMASYRKELQSDILRCIKRVNQLDSSTSDKFSALEYETDILYRRLNRPNFIINGLPTGLPDLLDPIIKIGSIFNVTLTDSNIQQLCYINKGKSVLVRLNNVSLRDKIMKEYFKTRSLKLCEVIGGDIENRIYLNDHFSPGASALNSVCRRILRLKYVKKFKILNKDKLEAELTLPNNEIVVYNVKQCADLLNKEVS